MTTPEEKVAQGRAEYEKLRSGKVRVPTEESDSDEEYLDAHDETSEPTDNSKNIGNTSKADEEPELDESVSAEEAAEHKLRGNELYKAADYVGAAEAYALAASSAHATTAQRATYLANLSAAQLARGEHDLVEKSASKCLALDETYRKARERRLRAREALRNYRGALEDAKLLGHPQSALAVLERQAQAKEKADAEKAMNELKGLADSFLSNFGMSVNDFAAKKDPDTGSYSISMNR